MVRTHNLRNKKESKPEQKAVPKEEEEYSDDSGNSQNSDSEDAGEETKRSCDIAVDEEATICTQPGGYASDQDTALRSLAEAAEGKQDAPTTPKTQPITSGLVAPSLKRKKAMTNMTGDEAEEKHNQDKANETLLELLKNRVLYKPKPLKKQKKPKEPKATDGEAKDATRARKRAKAAKPAWMMKGATLDDLVAVLDIQEGTDMVYVNIETQNAPYNTFGTKVVRQLLRMAKRHPSMCSEWNTVALMHDSRFINIPLNGRNAPRGAGRSKLRAFEALDAFAALGCEDVGVSSLKDLGYGSSKAREFKAAWDGNSDPTPIY
jgi:hypothetical protein